MILKTIKTLAQSLLILILLSLAVIEIKEVRQFLFYRIAKIVEDKSGYTIKAQEIDFTLPFRLKIHDLEIKDSKIGSLKIKQVFLKINPLFFLNEELNFDIIELNEVDFYEQNNSNEIYKNDNALNLSDFNFKVDLFNITNFQIHSEKYAILDNKLLNLCGNLDLISPEKVLNLEVEASNSNLENQLLRLKTKISQSNTKVFNGEFFVEGFYNNDRFFLKDPIYFQVKENKAYISPIKLIFNDSWIESSIEWTHDLLSANIETNEFPLSLISTYLLDEYIDGKFSGKARIFRRGTKLEGEAAVTITEMIIKNELIGIPFPINSNLSLVLKNSFLNIEANILSNDIFPIDLELQIPITTSFNPLLFEIQKDQSLFGNLKTSGSITPMVELLGFDDFTVTGNANVNIEITGSINHPKFFGRSTIQNGTVESLTLGTTLNNVEALFEGDDKTISLSSFSAHDEQGGKIEGNGTIQLLSTNSEASKLHFQIENFQILKMDYLKGRFNGLIDVIGNRDKVIFKGNLEATKMDYAIINKIDEVTETVDVIYINQNLREPPPTLLKDPERNSIPVEFDIFVKIPSTLNIDDDALNSKWKGNIHLGGNPEKLSLKGDIHLAKGDYILNGQQFNLSQGSVTFGGDIEKKTSLYLVASREIQEYRIDIVLQGNVTNPKIILRSSPSLPQQEVLSLILFGKSPLEISAFQDQQLEQSLYSLLKEQSGPGFVSKLQKSIGIDRIDFNRQDCYGSEDVSIQFGKYLTRNLYISLNKGFGDEPTRLSVEAKLKNEFKVQVDAGESTKGSSDNASGQISILWKHDY